MQWIFLLIAGAFETIWAVSLKYSEGFTQPIPSVITVIGMIASFYFLALALRQLPLGIAYAIWTGIGSIGALILGTILFHEWLSLPQLICVTIIISGIIGLRIFTT